MASITTDGARAFTGKNKGMITLLNNKLKVEKPDSDILAFHCILHQESLCKSALDFKHVIDSPVVGVVNIIRSRALNHRQFKSLLEDMEAEYTDVIYHNSIRWLSLGNVLKRIWDMQDHILHFLNMKGISCDFISKIKSEEWRYDMMFAADIFQKLNELNVSLQGKGLFAHEMLRQVRSFQIKIRLFWKHAGEGKFGHFPLLGKQEIPTNVSQRIRDQLVNLDEELKRRFQDFKKIEPEFHLISYPFSFDIDAVPENLQLELIDLQSDPALKGFFNSVKLSEFYESLSSDKYSVLKDYAGKMFSIFGSTYICEQSFSCMKINKNKNRSSLTDENLESVMKISTSNLTPDFKLLVDKCERLHLSH